MASTCRLPAYTGPSQPDTAGPGKATPPDNGCASSYLPTPPTDPHPIKVSPSGSGRPTGPDPTTRPQTQALTGPLIQRGSYEVAEVRAT